MGWFHRQRGPRKVSSACLNMCFLRKIWSNISICKNGKVYISNNSTAVNSIFIKNDDHFFFKDKVILRNAILK